jgi:hypothetical protein
MGAAGSVHRSTRSERFAGCRLWWRAHHLQHLRPIVLVEALRPMARREPWIDRIGLAVTAASGLVLYAHLAEESSHASAAQVMSSLIAVGALLAAAFRAGRRLRAVTEGARPDRSPSS